MIYNVDNLSLYPKDQNQFHKNYTFSKVDIRNEVEISEILNKFLPDKIINILCMTPNRSDKIRTLDYVGHTNVTLNTFLQPFHFRKSF